MRNFIPALTLVLCANALLAGCNGEPSKDDTDVDDTDVIDTVDTDVEDTDIDVDTDAACFVPGVSGTCWECDLPAAPEEDSLKALNQCTTSTYVAFDNAARIPAATWSPGDPLPAVP